MDGQREDGVLLRAVRLAGAPDPRRPRDVLVARGRVAAVADAGTLGPEAGPGAAVPVVDAGGAALLPGLVDAHVHLSDWAAAARRPDVSAAASPQEAAAVLAAADAGRGRRDDVLVGRGFRDGLWARAPRAEHLDAALPGRAVVVASQDLHSAWCSSEAVRRFRVVERFGAAAAAGLVVEGAAMALLGDAGAVPPEVGDAWTLGATQDAAARGTTAVVDLQRAPVEDWARRAAVARPVADGAEPGVGPALRVAVGVWREHLDGVLAAGLRSGDPLPGVADPVAAERVRLGPLKVFVDGSLGTRTAYCSSAYPEARAGAPSHGMLLLPAAELEGLLRRATSAGLTTAVHAIGDAGVRTALDAYEAAGCRGRVEHAQQVLPEDLGRFAALGVTASVQPRHAVDDRDLADLHWAGATSRAFPYAALAAAGADVVLGSDAPVAPLDPWDAVASAVHRTLDERDAWHPDQHLTLPQALAASCGGRSHVRVGDVADLVLLAEEPADVLARRGPAALRDPEVLGTLVGGLWTHRSPALRR
ncbi:amidohydrolase [uncultured Pseudokineococcus sp.]|uniref:amidohydrolase n=1 Tax=uncultured Pseudokineococcus sp. TaxID=1642928 RepID=UPI002630B009|nr:amidohydrolase family protein [uncultured Pseudokineococcus sp.]